jgi:hypothetical protein
MASGFPLLEKYRPNNVGLIQLQVRAAVLAHRELDHKHAEVQTSVNYLSRAI